MSTQKRRNEDPLDFKAQERDQKRREKQALLELEQDEGDLVWLMNERRGRRFVWRILERAGVFRSPFDTNALNMARKTGEKEFGIWVVVQINDICPELYMKMVREQKERKEE